MIWRELKVIESYYKERNKFLEKLKEKFDTFYTHKHDELNDLIAHINHTDKLINMLLDFLDGYESIDLENKHDNSSIERLITHYKVLSYTNEKEARKWLVNALVLVVADDYEYYPPKFKKGEKIILQTQIVKR